MGDQNNHTSASTYSSYLHATAPTQTVRDNQNDHRSQRQNYDSMDTSLDDREIDADGWEKITQDMSFIDVSTSSRQRTQPNQTPPPSSGVNIPLQVVKHQEESPRPYCVGVPHNDNCSIRTTTTNIPGAHTLNRVPSNSKPYFVGIPNHKSVAPNKLAAKKRHQQPPSPTPRQSSPPSSHQQQRRLFPPHQPQPQPQPQLQPQPQQSHQLHQHQQQPQSQQQQQQQQQQQPPLYNAQPQQPQQQPPQPQPVSNSKNKRGNLKLELPLSIPCKGGCGFYGSSESLGLCSKCTNRVKDGCQAISKDKVLEYLLTKCGYSGLDEVKSILSYEKTFPNAFATLNSNKQWMEIAGMKEWQTTRNPLTQYDEIPRKGMTACTFIAAVTALRLIWWLCVPDASQWSTCITMGVEAFHICKRDAGKDDDLHRNFKEVLKPVITAMGYSDVNLRTRDVCFKEVVVALTQPPHITAKEYIETFALYPKIGLDGLVECLSSIFRSYGQATGDDTPVAVVITRPPETYSACQFGGPQIYFRDSHRRSQYDFDGLEAFVKFVLSHPSFFVPTPPEFSNVSDFCERDQVSLFSVTPSIQSDIAQAIDPVMDSGVSTPRMSYV